MRTVLAASGRSLARGVDAPRLALLSSGLRHAALGFPDLPGVPVGIVRWDLPTHDRVGQLLCETPILSDALARVRRRPAASLARWCAGQGLLYADVDKRRPEGLAATLRVWKIDLVITSGCALVPMNALTDVPLGGINLHPSPLPRYRGGDPLLWQVVRGEPMLGVSVHRLATGSDTGDVLERVATVRPRGTSRRTLVELTDRDLGVPLLHRAISALAVGTACAERQPVQSPTCYAKAVSIDTLAERVPGEKLGDGAVFDTIAFLGEAPPAWLDRRLWRQGYRWKLLCTTGTRSATDGSANPAQSCERRIITRGPLVGIDYGATTQWLRPVPRS